MDILQLFFSWPNGSVWSNLLASAICFVLAGVWAHRKIVIPMRQHHARIKEMHELMKDKLDNG